MLRQHQSFLSKAYAVLDAAMVALALLAAWWVRFDTRILPKLHALPFHVYMSILVEAIPAFLAASALLGLYGTTRNSSPRNIALQTGKAAAAMALVVMSVLYFNHQVHYSRAVALAFDAFTWAFVVIGRLAVREILKEARRRGFNRKYVLLVGRSPAALRFVENLALHDELGYHVLGYLETEDSAGKAGNFTGIPAGSPAGGLAGDPASGLVGDPAEDPLSAETAAAREFLRENGIHCMGAMEDLDRVLREHIIDHVILTMPKDNPAHLPRLIEVAESHGVHTLLVPDFLDILPSRPRFDEFAGLPIVDTRYTPLDETLNSVMKRIFDIVFSLLVLVAGAPVFAAIALAVRLSSPGPVLYAQERLGRNRRPFRMYKFRTMYARVPAPGRRHPGAAVSATGAEAAPLLYGSPEDDGWTVPNDPRRTSVGRFLRRTSLDELPQFYNVLLGDMSVIGPRPERPIFVERFRGDVPRYMIKHRVRPGITGWAQVNGLRGDTSIEDRIEYDLRYIEQWSFSWDLRIILLTLVKGFRNKNAY